MIHRLTQLQNEPQIPEIKIQFYLCTPLNSCKVTDYIKYTNNHTSHTITSPQPHSQSHNHQVNATLSHSLVLNKIQSYTEHTHNHSSTSKHPVRTHIAQNILSQQHFYSLDTVMKTAHTRYHSPTRGTYSHPTR